MRDEMNNKIANISRMLTSTVNIESIVNNLKTSALHKIKDVLNNNSDNNTSAVSESKKVELFADNQGPTPTKAPTKAPTKEDTPTKAPTVTTDDPIAFKIIKKIISQFTYFLKISFIPFVAVMLAMLVTNEMIVYSAPIRIIFFIFTLIVCVLATPICYILAFFYIIKGGYSYYVNNMTDKPNSNIMPAVFALLPITTTKPTSSLFRFLYYPFTYPKTDKCQVKLENKMNFYKESLNESFKNLDKVKDIPIFSKDLEKISAHFNNLHKMPTIITEPLATAATSTAAAATTQ